MYQYRFNYPAITSCLRIGLDDANVRARWGCYQRKPELEANWAHAQLPSRNVCVLDWTETLLHELLSRAAAVQNAGRSYLFARTLAISISMLSLWSLLTIYWVPFTLSFWASRALCAVAASWDSDGFSTSPNPSLCAQLANSWDLKCRFPHFQGQSEVTGLEDHTPALLFNYVALVHVLQVQLNERKEVYLHCVVVFRNVPEKRPVYGNG